jgi:predicted RNase H-like HicB family nuclease
MRYPVAIETGSDTRAFGVVLPDLPGCFSAGDTLDEAIASAEEAVAAWIDSALDSGEPIPDPSTLEAVQDDRRLQGWSFGVVAVGEETFGSEPARVNISLPRRILSRLDAQARAAGKSRSGYIADLTLRGWD